MRDTAPGTFLVVNRVANEKQPDKPIFVRKQCMHCTQPSCVSACLCKAMVKTPEGPTAYHKDRCMGCRYCMISCPFDIPKFDYHSRAPLIEEVHRLPGSGGEGRAARRAPRRAPRERRSSGSGAT